MLPQDWMPAPNPPLDTGLLSADDFPPLPQDWVDRPIGALLAATAKAAADRIAIDDGERITYADLWASVAALAARVAACVAPGQAVGVWLPGDAGFVRAVLACLVAGRPCVPLDLNYPRQRLAEVLESAAMAAVIATAAEGATLPPDLPRIDPAKLSAAETETVCATPDPDAPALVLYTSGSTGSPKGIVNSSAALLQRVRQYVESGHLTQADQFLTLSSPCTIAGLRETLTPLLIGATLHIASPHRLGLRGVRQRMETGRVSVLNAVPAMLRSLIGAGGQTPFAALRLVRLGGDVVFWTDIPRLRAAFPAQCAIQIGYSSTEATGSQWFVRDDAAGGGACVPIGYLLPGNEAAIIREDGMAAAPGEAGELLIRSRFIALGQWHGGRVVAGAMRPDPEDARRRVLATGDLVRCRPDGLLDLIGRTDRQVKINGQRAEPAELEAVLRRHPQVADAAVLTLRDGATARFVAFAVAAEGDTKLLLRAQLRLALRGALPRWMQPARLHVIAAVPRLPAGKADMAALAALDAAGGGEPRSRILFAADTPAPVCRAVALAWRRTLGRGALHRAVPFDAAGGDSLRLMQLVFHVEALLAAPLPLDALMADMTAADMASAVAKALAAPSVVLSADAPPVLLLPGLAGDEPLLAQVRADLHGKIRFRLLSYPDWREMAGKALDLDGFVARLAAQVPESAAPLVLAGYSFGGAMADLLARRLIAEGRQVALLVILDTATTPRPATRLMLPRLTLRWGREMLRAARRGAAVEGLAEFVARHATHPRLRRMLRYGARFDLGGSGRFAFTLQSWLRAFLRMELTDRFTAAPIAEKLPCPVLLFRSDGHAADAPDDLGWETRSETVEVVRLGGTHHSMLDGRHRRNLCVRLTQAVAAVHPAPKPASPSDAMTYFSAPLTSDGRDG